MAGTDLVPEPLLPGVWWLEGTRGSNVYLVQADDGSLALIDPGFPSNLEPILLQLSAFERPLAAILLTHAHFDHAGAAADLHRATGARIVAGRGDCRSRGDGVFLATGLGRSHVARWLGAKVAPPPQDAPVHVPVDEEQEVLPGLIAVPTPGHTPGSLCYLLPRASAAFVGDLVISHGGMLTRPLTLANWDDACYLAALAWFAERAPEAGLPGHGEPVLLGFGEALRELARLPRRRGLAALAPDRLVRLMRFSRGFLRSRRGGGALPARLPSPSAGDGDPGPEDGRDG